VRFECRCLAVVSMGVSDAAYGDLSGFSVIGCCGNG